MASSNTGASVLFLPMIAAFGSSPSPRFSPIASGPAALPVCNQIRLPVSKSTASRPIGVCTTTVPFTANGIAAGSKTASRSFACFRLASSQTASSGWRVSGTRYLGTRSGREASTIAFRAGSPLCMHHSTDGWIPATGSGPINSSNQAWPSPGVKETLTSRPPSRTAVFWPVRARSRISVTARRLPARCHATALITERVGSSSSEATIAKRSSHAAAASG